jgi:uncharacterized protein (DUF3820 family)
MRMPFGKHRDEYVVDLPDSYLLWLHKNVELFGALEIAVLVELRDRGLIEDEDGPKRKNGHRHSPPPPPPSNGGVYIAAPDRTLLLQFVEAGYKALAKQHHPDLGGDTGAMKRINEMVKTLRAQLKV